MPPKLYSAFSPYGREEFSFNHQSLVEFGTPIYEHDPAIFFEQEASWQAIGHDELSKISKRELIELFCELLKV